MPVANVVGRGRECRHLPFSMQKDIVVRGDSKSLGTGAVCGRVSRGGKGGEREDCKRRSVCATQGPLCQSLPSGNGTIECGWPNGPNWHEGELGTLHFFTLHDTASQRHLIRGPEQSAITSSIGAGLRPQFGAFYFCGPKTPESPGAGPSLPSRSGCPTLQAVVLDHQQLHPLALLKPSRDHWSSISSALGPQIHAMMDDMVPGL